MNSKSMVTIAIVTVLLAVLGGVAISALATHRAMKPGEAEIVPPALEQGERRGVAVGGERLAQEGQVLADELLLEIDRVGAHHGALAIGAGPRQRRHEVRERLPDPGARLEQEHAAVVVGVRHVRGHVALAGAVALNKTTSGTAVIT